MRIAVNGLGRVGRLFLRAALDDDLPICAVNEPDGDAEGHALGLMFDSVQGRFGREVRAAGGRLHVEDKTIDVLGVPAFEDLPWSSLGVDLVVDVPPAPLVPGFQARPSSLSSPGPQRDRPVRSRVERDAFGVGLPRMDPRRLLDQRAQLAVTSGQAERLPSGEQ